MSRRTGPRKKVEKQKKKRPVAKPKPLTLAMVMSRLQHIPREDQLDSAWNLFMLLDGSRDAWFIYDVHPDVPKFVQEISERDNSLEFISQSNEFDEWSYLVYRKTRFTRHFAMTALDLPAGDYEMGVMLGYTYPGGDTMFDGRFDASVLWDGVQVYAEILMRPSRRIRPKFQKFFDTARKFNMESEGTLTYHISDRTPPDELQDEDEDEEPESNNVTQAYLTTLEQWPSILDQFEDKRADLRTA